MCSCMLSLLCDVLVHVVSAVPGKQALRADDSSSRPDQAIAASPVGVTLLLPSEATPPTTTAADVYKCPFSTCTKTFRRQSNVDNHVKYYHTSDGTPVMPPPGRKRQKTISVCKYQYDDFVSFLCYMYFVYSPIYTCMRRQKVLSPRNRHLCIVSPHCPAFFYHLIAYVRGCVCCERDVFMLVLLFAR